jgi:hypothetical protein
MKIQVTIKNVYGNELIYPMCKIGKAFADIAKLKLYQYKFYKPLQKWELM